MATTELRLKVKLVTIEFGSQDGHQLAILLYHRDKFLDSVVIDKGDIEWLPEDTDAKE